MATRNKEEAIVSKEEVIVDGGNSLTPDQFANKISGLQQLLDQTQAQLERVTQNFNKLFALYQDLFNRYMEQ